MARVPDMTVKQWFAVGLRGDRPDCVEFVESYREARASVEIDCLRAIRESKDWKAHMALLERVGGYKDQDGGVAGQVYDPERSVRDFAMANPEAAAQILVDTLRRMGKL
jgi:hypothetical protein